MFSVTGSNATAAAAMQNYLRSFTSYPVPIVIPNRFIKLGYYNIQLSLCNFLKRCSEGTAFVVATSSVLPSVSVDGSLLRSIATSFVVACSGEIIKNNIVNTWSASVNNVVQGTLVSQSKSSTTFRLNSYTLTTGSVYTIKFSSQYTPSQKTAAISVQVSVVQGNLLAVLKKGSAFSIRVGQNTTLDASASYDEDISPALRNPFKFTYAWTCIRIRKLPTVASNCSLDMNAASASTPYLFLYAGANSIDTTSEFTITVSDATRSSTVSTSVQVLALTSPVLAVASPYTSKFNTVDKLKISANVRTKSTVTATWSVNDTSVDLATYLQTPRTQILTVSNGVDTLFQYNLALRPNALRTSAYLAFTLTCVSLDSKSFTASVVIITNGAPTPGVFTVSPDEGFSLTDPFKFVASLWQDDDLPLTYTFGFISNTVSKQFQSLQSQSQLSYGTFVLPVGADSRSYALTCAMQVFDSFGLNTTATVNVRSKVASGGSSTVSKFITSSLSGNVDPDQVQSVISTATSALNAVNCRYAPNCTSLNRVACARVEHTCGSCISGFIGSDGDGNDVCYSPTTVSNGRVVAQQLRSFDQAEWSNRNLQR